MFEQDGVMIPFDAEAELKHGLKQVGKKFVFSINGVNPEDAGLYQLEVDGVKIFSTDLKRKTMHQVIHQHTFLVTTIPYDSQQPLNLPVI